MGVGIGLHVNYPICVGSASDEMHPNGLENMDCPKMRCTSAVQFQQYTSVGLTFVNSATVDHCARWYKRVSVISMSSSDVLSFRVEVCDWIRLYTLQNQVVRVLTAADHDAHFLLLGAVV